MGTIPLNNNLLLSNEIIYNWGQFRRQIKTGKGTAVLLYSNLHNSSKTSLLQNYFPHILIHSWAFMITALYYFSKTLKNKIIFFSFVQQGKAFF